MQRLDRARLWLLAVACLWTCWSIPFILADDPVEYRVNEGLAGAEAKCRPAGEFAERTLVDDTGTHRYTVYFPPGYQRHHQWPVILFLHGAGERGTDGLSPTYYGIGPVLRHSPDLYPAVVVFPQCETWDAPIFSSWSDQTESGRRAIQILDEVIQSESIDPARQSLTGWSMGGFGVTAFAARYPQRWQAALAISGGYAGNDCQSLSSVPLWLIHGERDSIVPVERSRHLAQSLLLPTRMARYDEVKGADHDVWEQVYTRDEIANYLLQGEKVSSVNWSLSVPSERLPASKDRAPFVAASTLPQAVSIRIGNDALAMISAGIPESIKPEQLQGELPPIEQTFSLDGDTYELALRDLTYTVRLDSVQLSTRPTADIRAELGIGLELAIGAASLKTQNFSASSSPFRIVIGHRRPALLSVLIKPHLDHHAVTLEHRESDFSIPDDNWFVEMPHEIQLTGSKFTRHEIETGIVGGLYTRKSEVEEQVRAVIPELLTRLEQRLELDEPIDAAKWLWPFPVYQPRLRWVPEQLSVDIHGLTLQLSAVIAASHFKASDRPQLTRHGTARLPHAVIHSRDFHVAIDPLLLEVISQEFVSAGVARINVRDLDSPFHRFAESEYMRQILPSIPAGHELQTVLALSSPFQWTGQEGVSNEDQIVQLSIPNAQLEIFSRPDSNTAWSPCGLFTIALVQSVQVQFKHTDSGPPLLGQNWLADFECRVSAAQSVETAALATLERDIQQAWASWAAKQSVTATPVNDIAIGDSRLRLDSIRLGARSIDIGLKKPPTQLSVTGQQSLRYRIRGKSTYWSLPRQLNSGDQHRFDVIDPVEIQLFNPRGATYTILPGEVANWDESTGVTFGPASQTTVDPPSVIGVR